MRVLLLLLLALIRSSASIKYRDRPLRDSARSNGNVALPDVSTSASAVPLVRVCAS